MSLIVTALMIWCPHCKDYSKLNMWRNHTYRGDTETMAGCFNRHVLAVLSETEILMAGPKDNTELIRLFMDKIGSVTRPLEPEDAFWHASFGKELCP